MIRVYTGLLGSGKTLSMVTDAYRVFKAQLPQVYTNMASLRFPHSVYVTPTDPDLVGRAHDGLFLLDEAHLTFDAYFWQRIPESALVGFTMLRKRGLQLFMTTQNMEQVASRLRSLVTEEVRCHAFGPLLVQRVRPPGDKKGGSLRVVRKDRSIFPLYDTLETFRNPASDLPSSETLRELRRRREPAPPGHAVAPSRRVWGWQGGSRSMRPLAREVADWLRVRERLPVSGWESAVVAEMDRWLWLARFGLSADDVPDASPDAPWLPGWSPAAVLDRDRALDQDENRTRRDRLRAERLVRQVVSGD